MVASPSLANFQFTTGRHSFSFLSKKSVQHTDSSRWPRGRERHRVGDYKERTMTRDEIATNASSKSRNLANFESTVWGYHFHSYTSELTEISTQEKFELEELKEKVRKMLVETPDNSAQKLVLIDTIQRLGVAYHFYNEIETSIQNIFNASQVLQSENNFDDNLYVVALRFRLVRQQGHYMSSDVFKQFTGHGGKFKETHDVLGLLSLYEAAHMRVHEEEILEEALTFTTTRLESILPNLSNSLKVEVNEALNQPIRKTVPRVGARKYICIYENSKSHNDLLLKFAKLDFNMLQKLHQQELNELTSWWKDLDIANKLPYAKDRFVEGYFWITGMSFEPQYSRVRRMLTKLVSVNTLIDDTYDAYGTFDELVIFTNAIQRWDIRAMDSLPPFMRTIYQALLNIYDEAEEVLAKEGKSDSVIYYAKNEMKKIVTAYMKETDWLNAGYIPKCEEYMTIALVTSGCMLYVTNSLVGIMEELMTKETIEWMTNGPLIICAASAICRLMNDIADHEVDQQRGHVASFVECYIKEYKALKEEAYIEIQKKIVNAWKEINKEFLCPKIPIFVLERALSYARLTDTLYKGGHDGYVNPKFKTKNLITLLLVQSVNI